MQASELNPFVCAECGGGMERVEDVPVLQSLAGHAIHRCDACGHILLVQEARVPEWTAGWLSAIPEDCGAISCASWCGNSAG